MKFCQKCGKELMDEAVICTGCGCSTASTPAPAPQNSKPITAGFAKTALILGIPFPIVGIIMGIYGTVKAQDPDVKKTCQQAIGVSIGVWLVCMGIMVAMMG